MSSRSPRVLLVNGESINSATPTGITMRTVLGGFPRQDLLEVCLVPGDGPPTIRSHVLSPKTEVLRHIGKRVTGGDVVSRQVNDRIRRSEMAEDESAYSAMTAFKQVTNAYLDIGPVRPDKDVVEAARRFRPDIVYTAGSTVTILRLARRLARACEAPLLLHHLDNWRESLYSGRSTWLPRRVLRHQVRAIEDSSAVTLTISEGMAEAYARRDVGTRFVPLMNAVDTTRPVQPLRNDPDEMVFTYAGGLHLRRHVSLLEVEGAIRTLRGNGVRCRLVIHTPDSHTHVHGLFDPEITEFRPPVTHDRVSDVYASADVLVHAESFDESILPFIKFSISTKISEYMASGRPILCFAPRDTALHAYVANHRVGLAPTDKESLVTATRRLAQEAPLRSELGVNGVRVAREHHSFAAAHRTMVEAITANTLTESDHPV